MCVHACRVACALEIHRQSPDPPQVARRMGVTSTVVQAAPLYLLLSALPLTAIAGARLEGHPLTLIGELKVQPLVGAAHDLVTSIANVHTRLGDAILWLAGFPRWPGWSTASRSRAGC